MIRQERMEDWIQVDSLITEAFHNAKHSDGNEAALVAALRSSDAFVPELSLVAEVEGEIVGYCLLTKGNVADETVLVLAPLAVAHSHQGKGWGRQLIETSEQLAFKMGYTTIMILGDPSYYGRLGYRPADEVGIIAPFDVPREYFLMHQLDETVSSPTGRLEYAKEFGI